MIPTSLVEVDVVRRPRDGVPTAVPLPDGESGPELAPVAEAFEVDIALLEAIGVKSAAGDVRTVPLPEGRFGWVVGIGSGEAAQWRTAGAALARATREKLGETGEAEGDTVDFGEPSEAEYLQIRLPAGIGQDAVSALALGLALGDYRFRVTGQPAPPRLRKALLVTDDEELREPVARAREWAAATALARDLANSPSNVKDPDWFTGLAARLAGEVDGLTATVRDEKWLADHGFGGILAVGGGSASPPRLLELAWRPADATGPHLVLVGKGITFDTGGISLKPAEGMHLMRTDMSGGAAVIGAMLAVARLGLRVRVTALVPSAENHLSGSSYRPGDVVRHYGGKTTEVGNTDAEGRMVMADALVYGVRHHEADLLVDVATLTGAMKVALGLRTGGVFATDPDLSRRLRDAGDRVGEAWWPMPLIEDHTEAVRGELADVNQTPPGPGGVTAALFLREFTEGLPWAHLDIAGPARADKNYAEVVAGGTGFAARSLVEFVASLAEQG
ncbi:leucyl aminopeptidase [Saccharopolyspora erythraea NRRL 2338]|uniref:Probable cytosol aminopeptidase n=2 Tax=Saccharopolyspora erythraea TaxID=1836 RepID=A4F8I7_SACEN|nr:leucyl aminopeptidase [Saccharopolyspora erythraea]EQD85115.1 peptidase M17 [Saccharopolyspora erythraea D]PFG94156.1 leucyl aminopeptidase [Saccharopolyspora erythraea NRRL 2338]QRK90944.1 leucyl aminopeptidase [Saccharopolyspora erythraea]CAM00362.1 leucine aminopeptidase [Saccharopolyspora erythraea NRRL 2338]